GGAVAIGTSTGFNTYSGSVSATQLVYDFGQTIGHLKATEYSADAQEATGNGTLHDTRLNVRTIYLQCRAANALVQLARDTLDNQQKHLNQVLGFIKVGTRPEIDAAQSKTDVANARLALIRAENTYTTARAQLNQAIGVPGPTDYDVADDNLP